MQNVINSLQDYLDESKRAGGFDARVFKNFLEPVFEREGYRDESESHEILIVHDAGIGDFVNLSPSLRTIRKKFPDDRITLACVEGMKPLARSCPYVDSIYYIRKADTADFVVLYQMQMKFASKLLKTRFDLAFCFTHYVDGILLAYMSGAKKIVHYAGTILCDPNIFPLTTVIHLVNVPISIQYSKPHIVDRYLGLIEGFCGESVEDRSLEVWFEPRCMKLARTILSEQGFIGQKIFAIGLGGTVARKHYPPKNYARLIEKISEEFDDARFVLLGGKNDRSEGEIIMDLFDYDPRILNLAGDLTYAETAAILSMCSMYIGNDTGTMHVAAGVDLPSLVPMCFPADHDLTPNSVVRMYAPRDVPAILIQPRESLPECRSMQDRFFGCQDPSHPHCITQIKVETMLAGFYLLLEKIRNNDSSVDLIF